MIVNKILDVSELYFFIRLWTKFRIRAVYKTNNVTFFDKYIYIYIKAEWLVGL